MQGLRWLLRGLVIVRMCGCTACRQLCSVGQEVESELQFLCVVGLKVNAAGLRSTRTPPVKSSFTVEPKPKFLHVLQAGPLHGAFRLSIWLSLGGRKPQSDCPIARLAWELHGGCRQQVVRMPVFAIANGIAVTPTL